MRVKWKGQHKPLASNPRADPLRRLPFGRGLVHQRLDAIGDALSRLTQLSDGPVGGVAFGDVVGWSVVDQTLGQGMGQHQVTLGDGDEGIAQTVKPELCTPGLADGLVMLGQVPDMARAAGG